MKEPENIIVYGLDDSVTGLEFKCICGKTVEINDNLVSGDIVQCPYCGRKYRFIIDYKLKVIR